MSVGADESLRAVTPSRVLRHVMDAESRHATEEKLRVSPPVWSVGQRHSSDSDNQTFVRVVSMIFFGESPPGGFVREALKSCVVFRARLIGLTPFQTPPRWSIQAGEAAGDLGNKTY